MDFSELYRTRWSPREYTAKEVEGERLEQVFEAARWAQSSFNEQPWRFLIATKNDGATRARLEGYLVEGNAYAKEAWVLGVAFAKKTFTKNDKPNRVAVHDLGAATQIIALKAFEIGLNSRFMAGFDVEKARELSPDDFEPVAMFVIGYAADRVLERGPGDRGRKPVDEYVWGGEWGSPYSF